MLGHVFAMPEGDGGTYATLGRMAQMSRSSSIQPIVRLTAAREVRGIPGFDGTLQAKVLRGWVDRYTTFLQDPAYAEALSQPEWLVRAILDNGLVQCDCDDVALLSAALGLSIGLRAKFVVVGFWSPNAPYRHVWCELAGSRGPWIPVDPTRPQQGLMSVPISRRAEIDI